MKLDQDTIDLVKAWGPGRFIFSRRHCDYYVFVFLQDHPVPLPDGSFPECWVGIAPDLFWGVKS